MNQVKIGGYINFEPETKFVGDKNLTSFTLSRKDKKGNYHNFKCNFWGLSHEIAKGVYLEVEGYLTENKWVGADGKNQSKVIVVCTSVKRGEFKKPENGTVVQSEKEQEQPYEGDDIF